MFFLSSVFFFGFVFFLTWNIPDLMSGCLLWPPDLYAVAEPDELCSAVQETEGRTGLSLEHNFIIHDSN